MITKETAREKFPPGGERDRESVEQTKRRGEKGSGRTERHRERDRERRG